MLFKCLYKTSDLGRRRLQPELNTSPSTWQASREAWHGTDQDMALLLRIPQLSEGHRQLTKHKDVLRTCANGENQLLHCEEMGGGGELQL